MLGVLGLRSSVIAPPLFVFFYNSLSLYNRNGGAGRRGWKHVWIDIIFFLYYPLLLQLVSHILTHTRHISVDEIVFVCFTCMYMPCLWFTFRKCSSSYIACHFFTGGLLDKQRTVGCRWPRGMVFLLLVSFEQTQIKLSIENLRFRLNNIKKWKGVCSFLTGPTVLCLSSAKKIKLVKSTPTAVEIKVKTRKRE